MTASGTLQLALVLAVFLVMGGWVTYRLWRDLTGLGPPQDPERKKDDA